VTYLQRLKILDQHTRLLTQTVTVGEMLLRYIICVVFVCLMTFQKASSAEGKVFCQHHVCDGTKCLPHQWVCDGEPDCHDGSDETGCEPPECEEDVDFQCENKAQCVPLKWKCDGDKDCSDGSDESGCGNMTCAEDHVSCGPGSGCIHISFVCDGHVDCPGGLDEKISTCKNKTCLDDEFQCHNDHRCISERWRCDGDSDCDDKSDEADCPESSCDEGHFQCLINTTQCIPLQWHCDGGFDCHDATDERDCDHQNNQHCDANEYFCPTSQECIHSSWLCDTDVDCGDGSDEIGCGPPTCQAEEFQCRKNGNCIPAHWRCDQNVQCDDRSDEEGCIQRNPCNPHTEFDCSGGKEPNCIPIAYVCDRKNNCGAYEDEAQELCHQNRTNPCTIDDGGCMHTCVNTVLGHYCTCHPGYKLSTDNQTCEDIDECSIPGSCSQTCNNTKGGFKCSCRDGYDLDPHHHTCLAQDEPSLIFANRHELREIHLRNGNYRLLKTDLQNTRMLDYDFSTGALFWSDSVARTISWLALNSSGASVTEVLVSGGIKSVDGLAFDWIHKNLYWTDSGNNHIEVLGMETGSRGRWQTTLISGLDDPKAIVLDPRSQKYLMYWTECGKSPKIRSASLDGTNMVDVIRSGSDILWPNGLTLDYESDVLYWTDMKLHIIVGVKVGPNGPKDRKIVLTSFTFLRHPFSVTVFEDNLYWTDWQTESVLKVNKFNANSANVTRVATRLHMPMDVRVYHQLRQPKGENICANKCSHICLPTVTYAKFNCSCPNSDTTMSYKLNPDRTTCLTINSTDVPIDSVSLMPEKQLSIGDKEPGRIAGIVLGIISVILVIAVISLFVMKKYRKRSIKSMNFDNPVYRKRSEDQFSLEKNEYNPSCDLPPGVSDELAQPLRLSCENYLMSEK